MGICNAILFFVLISIYAPANVSAVYPCNLPYCPNTGPGYQSNSFYLSGVPAPEICVEYPQDSQFPYLADRVLPDVQKSIASWNTELNIAAGKNGWNLIERVVHQGNNLTSCSVVIIFEKSELSYCTITNQPYLPPCNYGSFNGMTIPNNSRATIFIPYLLGSDKECQYTRYNMVFQKECRSLTELVSDTGFFKAIQHELGHALGMGHYVAHSQQEADQWVEGAVPPPSIMISGQKGNIINAVVTLLDAHQVITKYESEVGGTSQNLIPSWIKNNAKWWSQGQVSDDEFVKGIQYLIQNGVMHVPQTQTSSGGGSHQIPQWVRNNAGWWASGQISDDEFVKGIQYLISNGIISTS